MAHEIGKHDGLVLAGSKAWHGLGVVVSDAPTPKKALEIANLNWEVQQWALSATDGDGHKIALPGKVLNVRSDIYGALGVVSDGYKPIQNAELAEFCQLLAEQGDEVKVESAGSIRNGEKVWFLLKGDSFSVGKKKDEVSPYILVSNGHDGGTALRCTPTTVRVVCSNTLHMVIPRKENGRTVKMGSASYMACHLGDIRGKVEDAKQALGLYGRSLEATRQMLDQTAAKQVTREDVQRFFLECYTRDFGPIAANPKDAAEERARSKSQDAFVKVMARFDAERKLAGTTAWNVFNAYTGWSQNDRTFWKNAEKEDDRRTASKLFGQDIERATAALMTALAL